MILVTGATGTVGTAVLAALGNDPMVVRAVREERPTMRTDRWFDFEKPQSYSSALAGVDRLFLLRPPNLRNERARFEAVLGAAKTAGVRHVVFLSIRDADRLTFLPHRALEQAIEASGIAWTHLRPNDFMQNFATQPIYRDGVARGELRAAGGRSKTSYVDVRDVGEAAAALLRQPGHEGRAYSLTGPENVGLDQVAAEIGRAIGRPVRYRRSSQLGFYAYARRHGAPPGLALVMTVIGLVARLGYSRGIDPELPQLLGRAPRTFRQFAADYADTWRSETL